jgi:hypothetical protein
MIASQILIQADAGPAAIMTAAVAEVPGVPHTASAARPRNVTARAETRDTRELARPVTSRARAPGGGTRTMSCPVSHR